MQMIKNSHFGFDKKDKLINSTLISDKETKMNMDLLLITTVSKLSLVLEQ